MSENIKTSSISDISREKNPTHVKQSSSKSGVSQSRKSNRSSDILSRGGKTSDERKGEKKKFKHMKARTE